MRERKISWVIGYFNTQEISEQTKILHFKPLMKISLYKLKESGIIINEHHIINIEKKNRATMSGCANEHAMIRLTLDESNNKDNIAELLKSGSWSLFETIECTTKKTNMLFSFI